MILVLVVGGIFLIKKETVTEISLSDQDKISFNTGLNNDMFFWGVKWIPNDYEETFDSFENKLSFLSQMVTTYGHIFTDLDSNKTYYKASSIQEKSIEYFGEEIDLMDPSIEYYAGDEYSDYIYVESREHYMTPLNPTFKVTKLMYDNKIEVYTLFVDILSRDNISIYADPEEVYYFKNDVLDYDQSLVVTKGEIKYKKSEDGKHNYLVSFKYEIIK